MGINSWVSDLITQQTLSIDSPVPGGSQSMGLNDQSILSDSIERYATDYYSGNQVMIFIGDLWIDDITMLQFQAHQNKRPFYGYKSQRWDTVADGTQLVEGVFSINYTHTNYLNMALGYSLTKTGNPLQSTLGKINEVEIQQFITDAKNDPTLLRNLSYDVSGNPLGTQFNSKFNSLGFDDKQNLLEQFLWGDPPSQLQFKDTVLTPDKLPGFDIVISFGNYPQDRPGGGPDEVISSHTTKIINDVRILSHSIQVSVTGEPVQEVYTFIARGVDSPLTRRAKRFTQGAEVGQTTPNNPNIK